MPKHSFCYPQSSISIIRFKISPSLFSSHTHKHTHCYILFSSHTHKHTHCYIEFCLAISSYCLLTTRDNMKNRASAFVKQVIASLSSMAKSKTLVLKSKTNTIKARLIIFSLLSNRKFLMSSISDKFQSFLGHHSNPNKEQCLLEDHGSHPNIAILVYNDDDQYSYEAVPNPSETQVVEDKDQDCYESYYRYGEDDGGKKYPDLTHTVFDSDQGLDLEASVIDLVKNSKEEAGQEFKMEDDIDHMADLFIQKIHRQIFLQKQDSLKRCREMLSRGA